MTSLFNRLACLAVLAAVVPACVGATIVQGRSVGDVFLSNLAGVNVSIMSLILPAAGQYVAIGRASIVNWTGQQDSVHCAVALGGVPLDWAVTVTGGPHAPSAAGVTTQALVNATSPNQQVTLQCYHDLTISSIKADGGATLIVSDTLPGPKGPQGAPGARGATGSTGPSSATKIAVCVGVNAMLPTSQTCSCPSGKLARLDTNLFCSATGQFGTCSASGYPEPNYGSTYFPACCECSS
jgi:hypothetical protein